MNLPSLLLSLFILLFSIILHEFAHGFAAWRSGDDTAKVLGRLTFNPLPHIDPVGTILMPLLLVAFRSPVVFGMAKPVPINPLRFRDYDRGMIAVSLAGPLSNIALGFVLAGFARISGPGLARTFCHTGAVINFILAFFNLVPIPPMDGSRIVSVFLPYAIRARYDALDRYGMLIVFVLIGLGFFEWIHPLAAGLASLAAGLPLR